MATLSLYYDNKSGKVALNLSHLGEHARHFLPISLQKNQWDTKTHSVVNHPNRKELNIYLQSILSQAQTTLLQLASTIRLRSYSAIEIRDKVCEVVLHTQEEKKAPTFVEVYEQRMAMMTKVNTHKNYYKALQHIKRYDKDWKTLRFEDITPVWLDGFNKDLERTMPKPLARRVYFTYIQAVVNYAIANEYTTYSGFRKYKIPSGLAEKRDYSLAELRKIFSYQGKTFQEVRDIDILKLIFFLRGINYIDLSKLTEDNIKDGRLTYFRSKTGAYYDIKLEPEAIEIINKYKGDKMLLKVFDRCKSYECPYAYMNYVLKDIAKELGIPHITSYYFRHTWATIGFNDCGIPMEVISIGLGHSYGLQVTNMYISKNSRLADKANRLIMDYVLYDKKEQWQY